MLGRAGASSASVGQRPDERVEPVGAARRRTRPSGPNSHIWSSSAGQAPTCATRPAHRAPRPARRAAHLPRVARTCVTGTPRRPGACTPSTRSPPWLTSATMRSASKSRIGRDGGARPVAGRGPCDRAVGEHVGAAVLAEAGGDDAAGVGVGRRGHRRIDRDHDAAEFGRRVRRAALDPVARHRARPARSSTSSPSSSCRPSRVPA